MDGATRTAAAWFTEEDPARETDTVSTASKDTSESEKMLHGCPRRWQWRPCWLIMPLLIVGMIAAGGSATTAACSVAPPNIFLFLAVQLFNFTILPVVICRRMKLFYELSG